MSAASVDPGGAPVPQGGRLSPKGSIGEPITCVIAIAVATGTRFGSSSGTSGSAAGSVGLPETRLERAFSSPSSDVDGRAVSYRMWCPTNQSTSIIHTCI